MIEKEKELLNKISSERYIENNKRDYLKSNERKDSYYEEPGKNSYVEEYQFETPVEMKGILEKFFPEMGLPEEMLLVVLAATFKLRGRNSVKEEIMETIYNF